MKRGGAPRRWRGGRARGMTWQRSMPVARTKARGALASARRVSAGQQCSNASDEEEGRLPTAQAGIETGPPTAGCVQNAGLQRLARGSWVLRRRRLRAAGYRRGDMWVGAQGPQRQERRLGGACAVGRGPRLPDAGREKSTRAPVVSLMRCLVLSGKKLTRASVSDAVSGADGQKICTRLHHTGQALRGP
jgi:hypothetical protein